VAVDGRLLAVAERAMVVAQLAERDKTGIVQLTMADGEVTVSAKGQGETFTEAVGLDGFGEATVCFNGRYLIEALKLIGEGQLALSPDVSAAVITAVGVPEYRHLLLPVVVRGGSSA
ncbi:MAG: hypothetical protein ACPLRW_13720, partial [Moorellales bacterium]